MADGMRFPQVTVTVASKEHKGRGAIGPFGQLQLFTFT
jgi:hypothetical protein